MIRIKIDKFITTLEKIKKLGKKTFGLNSIYKN